MPEAPPENNHQAKPTDDFDVDGVIKTLLMVQHKTPGTLVSLELSTIQNLIQRALPII
jgi:hypothetical protein